MLLITMHVMLLMCDFVWGPQDAQMILISSDVLLPLSLHLALSFSMLDAMHAT